MRSLAIRRRPIAGVRALALLTATWLLGCGGRSDLGQGSTGGGGPGPSGAGSDRGGSAGGSDDAGASDGQEAGLDGNLPQPDGTAPPSTGPGPSLGGQSLGSSIEGNWVLKQMTDCAYTEDWLYLSPPDQLVHSVLDESACNPQAPTFTVDQGTYQEADGQRLRLEWTSADGTVTRRIDTTTVINVPLTEEQGGSGRAINHDSYVRLQHTRTFRRLRRHQTLSATGNTLFDEETLTDVTFDDDISDTDDQVACQVTVELYATLTDVAHGIVQPLTGRDSFTLPCHYGPAAASEWLELSLDGTLQGIGNTAPDFVERTGIYERHPEALVRAFSRAFSPVLYLEHRNTDVMFEGRFDAVHFHSDTPPQPPQ
jgi:hypothetical protein